MSFTYFGYGMQLIFITTHLPAYLAICGVEPILSAQALTVIGGFNALGSLFFGWAGGRWNKRRLGVGVGLVASLMQITFALVRPSERLAQARQS